MNWELFAAFLLITSVLGYRGRAGAGLVHTVVAGKLLGRLSGVALIGGGVWLSLSRRPA
jgi:hypothetical protein